MNAPDLNTDLVNYIKQGLTVAERIELLEKLFDRGHPKPRWIIKEKTEVGFVFTLNHETMQLIDRNVQAYINGAEALGVTHDIAEQIKQKATQVLKESQEQEPTTTISDLKTAAKGQLLEKIHEKR